MVGLENAKEDSYCGGKISPCCFLGWLVGVEQVVRVCRDHGLYSALIYLFTKGLDDFKSPLEELLTVAQNLNNTAQAKVFG